MKKNLLLILLVAVAGTFASVLVTNHQAAKPAEPIAAIKIQPATAATAIAEIMATPKIVAPEKSAGIVTTQKDSPVVPVAKPQKSGKGAKVKPPIQDPAARAALSLVGVDPTAEQYWADAINDPNLSAIERKDLIEDLNEDGLSDPKHPGAEDLPLIVNRLRLIDELAPYAMDQVNADAFQEAQKDLLAMLDGKPVQ